MKVHNIRFGFATNSSSVHSIILLKDGAHPVPGAETPDYGGSFGWDNFLLTDRQDKLRYLAAAVRANLAPTMSPKERDAIVMSWIGPCDFSDNDYIDHQSLPSLPREWESQGLNFEFVQEIKDFFLRDDVVIQGGNDNDERASLVVGEYAESGLGYLNESGNPGSMVARKDSTGYWVIFDRSSGSKFRVTIDPSLPEPKTADAPELLDVKITDYCPVGCAFCYQGSTTAGTHASLETLRKLADACRRMQVFEVAIGGGEPTLHPNFAEVLRSFSFENVTPNFTTRMTHWMLDDSTIRQIVASGGAFAFSVDSIRDFEKFVGAIQRTGIDKEMKGRIVVQYILGVSDSNQLYHILHGAHTHNLPVTLLGWKTTGRGSLIKPKSSDWVDTIQELRKRYKCPSIGVDTCIVQQHADALKTIGVDKKFWTAREGVYSAYIDAVASLMHTSSYELLDGQPLPGMNTAEIIAAWKEIRKVDA